MDFWSRLCIKIGGGVGVSCFYCIEGIEVDGGGTRTLFLLAYVKISFFLNTFLVF
jgi:hypothetical protein